MSELQLKKLRLPRKKEYNSKVSAAFFLHGFNDKSYFIPKFKIPQ